MRHIKRSNKFLKITMCCLAAILALSSIYTPKTSAAETYFIAEGSTLNLDEIDPTEPDQRLVSVTLKAARAMTIHSLHGYFTPINNDDEELQRYMSWMDYSSGISSLCYSMSTGEFDWNTPDCKDDVAGDEGIHVQAGDPLIFVTFEVKDSVDVMKRYMPVKIALGVVDDGSETGKQVKDVTMDAYVRAGHELSVYKYITGNGDLDVPNIVVGGTDVEVGIVPESGYELTYLELNGQEITDQVKNNVYNMTPSTESLTFYATFRRIYHVIEGDGSEHIAGSKEALSFKIDNDVTEFCSQGLLIIDGENIDMEHNCTVDPDNQTIILSANFLNTLALGEHSFEAWFSEPESGSAKATFKIIEEGNNEGENDYPAVPNSGLLTNNGEDAAAVDNLVPFAMIIGFIVAIKTTKRMAKRN